MARNVFGWLVVCLLFAAPLSAQENPGWPERSFVTIDVPFQVLNNDFAESLRFADAVRKTENMTFVAGYPSTRGALFDIGAGVRVAKSVGIGLSASQFQRSSSGSFALTVPNPFVANQPLDLAGSIPALKHRELGVHIQALYALRVGKRARVMLVGGPSIFRTKQDVVRSIEFTILPGFTSLVLDRALVTRGKQTVGGFNVGGNITWTLGSHFGLATLTRYSRANVTFAPDAGTDVNRAIKTHAGGLHVGCGIQFLF